MHINMYDHNQEYSTNALHNLKNDKRLQRLNLFKRRYVRTSLRWWPIGFYGVVNAAHVTYVIYQEAEKRRI